MEMAYKLDLKDRKILYELDLDCRQSCSQIGKKVGLSTDVVNYRIKKLEEEKIITQYQLIVNLAKLGIIQFKLCLGFHHLTSEKLEEMIEKLKKKEEVKWIVSCNGNWDMLISLEVDSLSRIDELENEILEIFEIYVKKKELSIAVKASTFNRDYLIDKKQIIKERTILDSSKKVKIDELDIEIIKKLAQNARKSIVDIAVELRRSPRVINYRIKQLLKEKIIEGFRIAINYDKLGVKFFKTFIYLDRVNEQELKEFRYFFFNNRNIIHNMQVIGAWDFEPEFEVYSEEEFNHLISDMKDKFANIIGNIEIITISKEHKFVYF